MSEIKQTAEYDEEDGLLKIARSQDIRPILEANKQQRNNAPMRHQEEVFNHCARIPNILIEEWLKEGLNVFDNSPETKRKLAMKLNSPEYAYLRTNRGKI